MVLEELISHILGCDENIQHVGIVDNNGKIIRSDIKIVTSDSQQLQKLQISYDLNIVIEQFM